ncbi:transcriptional regulator, LacI family [Thermanaeromonas toyohensis ToBE]|uniref:Transcriptional regulator, LacI family n=1 Tax=Thermanaeromonas toyohensis ToBE TaxID=698762 RepID=A0A1W1VK58_9FIRM|nr:LacI family DNA-binding transcriptional regulator [Thermanaeromonas toyohensis]SMB93451.1 transcriptional regulator, LacI family [Thermanaeromonas toyohensis ToBE]
MAKRAKVGISTVSRVLNNSGYVSPKTRERVLKAIEELNFEPNYLAKSLSSGKTRTIALILPDITNPFFPAIARGVEDAVKRKEYHVILCNTDGDSQQEALHAKALREKAVDGLIFTASSKNNKHVLELVEVGIPVVLIDRRVEGNNLDAVLVDNVAGAYEATKYLIGLGHKYIGFIAGPDVTTALERQEGYCRALKEAGIEVKEKLIQPGNFRYESGYTGALNLLEYGVTAILAANDLMALGAMRAIEEKGLRIPQDIAVVGFDDIPLASLVKPALTTVNQPAYQMGALAAEILLERIEGKRAGEPKEVILTPSLVIRESCGGRGRWQT